MVGQGWEARQPRLPDPFRGNPSARGLVGVVEEMEEAGASSQVFIGGELTFVGGSGRLDIGGELR
jgi:hypothetical protein